MSTIFGHGRLRLYLLKLLDENPRHGYEIISLLRDRFLGVYSPSPGTIYPRLARLEEEGLVTHTEEGGRKVYSLTDKGREELRERENDLNDLEREITDSVRDIARAVKQDVRATISSLRDELKFASGGARRSGTEAPGEPAGTADSTASEESGRGEEAADASGKESGESREQSGQGCEDGSRWSREWERFTQGFGAFGAAWGGRRDSERPSQGPEFERALHDFGDRVRDVVREAGHVGEAAATDLRRILDDTVEVIRRDMRHWGPPADRAEGSGDGADGAAPAGEGAATAPETGKQEPTAPEKPAAPEQSGTSGDEPVPERPGTSGDEPAPEGGTRPRPSADPWSEAVDDPGDGR
ncbi:helix-turn-helix transcriptional regulator [Nocardiopsis dassonvillei]|uniref:helix-turn-helix transcriptional regulator n=1 Tax=Nocardiopsis dassonvillei TaxID=2014 RepID=UPI00200BDED4|nr:helix-turn-helix transcriptional regulator [Nocardiopsis dassonvillei]MCK9870546.1 helix-turn-helix transcriptional regulator [Nocardiopsis dassonvillei]